MRKTAAWYTVLLACRKVVARGDPLTSTAVAQETGLPVTHASAWLCKFFRFGYTLRKEKVPTNRRWAWVWELTDWGHRYKVKGAEPARRYTAKVAANPKKPSRNQG